MDNNHESCKAVQDDLQKIVDRLQGQFNIVETITSNLLTSFDLLKNRMASVPGGPPPPNTAQEIECVNETIDESDLEDDFGGAVPMTNIASVTLAGLLGQPNLQNISARQSFNSSNTPPRLSTYVKIHIPEMLWSPASTIELENNNVPSPRADPLPIGRMPVVFYEEDHFNLDFEDEHEKNGPVHTRFGRPTKRPSRYSQYVALMTPDHDQEEETVSTASSSYLPQKPTTSASGSRQKRKQNGQSNGPTCPFCGVNFCSPYSLNRHLQHSTTTCGKKFRGEQPQQKQQNNTKCKFCERILCSSYGLTRHLRRSSCAKKFREEQDNVKL